MPQGYNLKTLLKKTFDNNFFAIYNLAMTKNIWLNSEKNLRSATP